MLGEQENMLNLFILPYRTSKRDKLIKKSEELGTLSVFANLI